MYSIDWPRAHGIPHSIGSIKLFPEDFQVNEFFAGQFSGQGEHIVLRIEKKGLTTEEVVKSLGKLINKPTSLISYAGLKDKHALTTQWLSIHAPGEIIPGIQTLAAPGWRVLECTRHHKKLRPGFLSGNQFIITLRNITDREDLIQRIELIKLKGVPNYFGEQRFGREGANLIKAEAMLVQGRKIKDRFLKGIYCSAARSWIYNLILAKRVLDSSWDKPLYGDVMQLSGSNSIFVNELALDEKLLKRIADKDISPASPLPGKCKNLTKEQRLTVINQVYEEWSSWLNGLEKYGLEEAWRANILHTTKFEYSIKNDKAELSFILSAGAYATTVLRELISY